MRMAKIKKLGNRSRSGLVKLILRRFLRIVFEGVMEEIIAEAMVGAETMATEATEDRDPVQEDIHGEE